VIPDGLVTCEDLDLNETFIVAPKLVVEVLSPESINLDRVTKLDIYRAIPSIHEYLMVDSRRPGCPCTVGDPPTPGWT